jgi:hypothetical protein
MAKLMVGKKMTEKKEEGKNKKIWGKGGVLHHCPNSANFPSHHKILIVCKIPETTASMAFFFLDMAFLVTQIDRPSLNFYMQEGVHFINGRMPRVLWMP